MPNRLELEASLWSAAEQAALRNGFGIASDCADLLRGFIGDGIQRIINDGFLNDLSKHDLARTNLNLFVDDMAKHARALGLTELHEQTFFLSRWLCPILPFC